MRMLAEDELREAVLLIFANKQVYLDDIKSLKSLRSIAIMSYHELRRILEKIIPILIKNFSINDNYQVVNYFRICLTQ